MIAALLSGACGYVIVYDVDSPCIDADGDGYVVGCAAEDDCDDSDPSRPGPEICNDVDDDCDGRWDEGTGRGDPCVLDGGCAGRIVCRADGPACEGLSSRDPCNGVDDDCDGEVDEQIGRGSACVTGLFGRCAGGHLACEGVGIECSPVIEPGAVDEICNGLDDDCDGVIDEGAPEPRCYPGPPGTDGVGACHAGRRRCDAGRPLTCVGATLPQPERCDGVDDDCDGSIDEALDCGCMAGDTRPCPPRAPAIDGVAACVAGEQSCDGGAWGACRGLVDPGREICDGVDDDCDGLIDERAVGVDGACVAGLGRCQRAGLLVCEGGRLRCDAELGQPEPESCWDGLDENCDGVAGAPVEVGQPCEHPEGVGIFDCGDGLECLWSEPPSGE